MADITMCRSYDCPHAKQCHRATATPDEFWQSYFITEPFEEEDGKTVCDYYWGVNGEKVWSKEKQEEIAEYKSKQNKT